MQVLINILLRGIAVFVTAYLLPGVLLRDFWAALVAAVVLAIVNAVLKPVLVLLTLPITVLTLGLFYFVINALLVLLVSYVIDGFSVNGFLWALLFSLVVSFINSALNAIF